MTPSEEKRYVDYMSDIKNRVDFLRGFTAQVPPQIRAELYAVQLRKIVEGIVFSSLVANREKYAELHANFVNHWRIGKIVEAIKKFNKRYLPIPIQERPDNDGVVRWHYPTGPQFLSEEDLLRYYESASNIIHSPKPFAQKPTNRTVQFIDSMLTRINKVVLTLNCHQIHFDEDEVYLVHFTEPNRTEPVIYRFEKLPIRKSAG